MTLTQDDPSPAKGQFKAPDTFVILFFVALIAWVATLLVPAGRFVSEDGAFDLSSFEYVGRQPAGLFETGEEVGFLNFLFEGLIAGDRYSSTIGLMAFLLIVGGAFGITMRTGAMEAALKGLIANPGARGDYLAPLLFVLFSLGGAVFGMGEEAIVFVMILAPGFSRAGYDSLTVLMVTYVATQVGFATSWMNPFSVVVAQGIAGLDVMSGAGLRVSMWAGFTALGAAFAYRYARRIRLAPETSLTFKSDQWLRDLKPDGENEQTFNMGHALILLIVLAGIGWVAWGVGVHKYYFPEISAQFFAIGLAAAIVACIFSLNKMDINACGEAFRDGAVQLAPAAIIIAFAKGIVVLLGGDDATNASVLNTALYGMAQLTEGLPGHIAAVGMYVLQSVINLFVVSGSGQAALTMPLIAPLSDLIGVERQTAVLAFQLGDGLMNLIVPSSAALMGCLAAARVDWGLWVQFLWKGLALAMGAAIITILIAVSIGYA
ncbi:MAG: putative basic amino acid antiporter YfcC [Pseudomonadota bacterium]